MAVLGPDTGGGDKGASVNISGGEDFGFIYSSGDMDTLILGVNDASRILDSNPGAEGKKAVLILPADEGAAAAGLVRDAFADGYAGENLKKWLSENQLENLSHYTKFPCFLKGISAHDIFYLSKEGLYDIIFIVNKRGMQPAKKKEDYGHEKETIGSIFVRGNDGILICRMRQRQHGRRFQRKRN